MDALPTLQADGLCADLHHVEENIRAGVTIQ
jgi:hypothetical protein